EQIRAAQKFFSGLNSTLAEKMQGWRFQVPGLVEGFQPRDTILFMEKAAGKSYDKLEPQYRPQVGPLIVESSLRLLFREGWFDADRHTGNQLIDAAQKIIYPLDFGQATEFSQTAFWKSDERYELAQFLRALGEGDAAGLLRHGQAMSSQGSPRDLPALRQEIEKVLAGDGSLPDRIIALVTAFADHGLRLDGKFTFGAFKGLMTLFGEDYVPEEGFRKMLSQEIAYLLKKKLPLSIADLFTKRSPRVPSPAPAQSQLDRRFLDLHAAVRAGTAGALPESAGSFRYLFVRGFMGNHIKDYQTASVGRLQKLGLDADFIDIATEGDSAGAAARIAQTVGASDKPVILISHSRGGVLVHDWYRTASPELKAKAARLVLLQAPLKGSPLADFALEHLLTRMAARMLGGLPGWGDVLATTGELSTAQRRQALAQMPALNTEDLAKIYAIATYFDPDKNTPAHKDMRYFHRMITERTGQANDGLVPVDSANVPGAHNLVLPDLDHEDTVLEHAGWVKRLRGSRPNPELRADDISETILRLILAPPAR
ncbi:MAG: AarF/UbiB family protein, partial [Elusimicrobiota bacterium]